MLFLLLMPLPVTLQLCYAIAVALLDFHDDATPYYACCQRHDAMRSYADASYIYERAIDSIFAAAFSPPLLMLSATMLLPCLRCYATPLR